MSPPRRRKRVAEGIYEDQWGLAATVKVGPRQREQRFPNGTSLEFLAAWRERTRDDLLDTVDEEAPPLPGTFADDAPRFEQTIAGRVSFKADRSHLRAWLPRLGPLLRRKIRPAHVTAAIAAWTTEKVSARTIRHRVRVLRELYRALDGRHAPTPTAGVTLPKPADPHPVAVPWSMVQAVAKSLKRGKRGKKAHGQTKRIAPIDYAVSVKGYARFLVRATTGQRPVQIMRATPEDVDLKRKLWYVRAAKGGVAIALPLDAEMVKAWKTFIKADAWGSFNTTAFGQLLRRHGWSDRYRPYALRSTLAIDMILGGADLSDVQAALGHRRIQTTQTHYAGLQLARARKTLRRRRRGALN